MQAQEAELFKAVIDPPDGTMVYGIFECTSCGMVRPLTAWFSRKKHPGKKCSACGKGAGMVRRLENAMPYDVYVKTLHLQTKAAK